VGGHRRRPSIREPSAISAVLDRALAFANRSGPWRSWTLLTIQIQLAAGQLGASITPVAPSVAPLPTAPEGEPPSEWAAAKARIRAQIPEIAFLNWFESTRQLERSGAVITVAVPDASTAVYVAREYERVIKDAASSEGIGEIRFVLQTEANVMNESVHSISTAVAKRIAHTTHRASAERLSRMTDYARPRVFRKGFVRSQTSHDWAYREDYFDERISFECRWEEAGDEWKKASHDRSLRHFRGDVPHLNNLTPFAHAPIMAVKPLGFEENTMPAPCIKHEGHTHTHGQNCGHTAVKHDGHTDYLHDGHLHHIHDGHVDDHTIAVGGANPANCTPGHNCGSHEAAHTHGPNCGHEAVPHGDHTDYLVNGHLHHPHGKHCDDHGKLATAA